MLKNDKGVTLTILVVTIIVLLIIVSTLVYSATSSINIRKLNRLYNDIRQLNDAVAVYYLENSNAEDELDRLPIYRDNEYVISTDEEENKTSYSWN